MLTMRIPRHLYLLPLFALAACVVTPPAWEHGDGANSTYNGPECASRSRDLSDTPAQIFVRICGDRTSVALAPKGTKASLAASARHQHMDDRRPDDVEFALLIIDASHAGSDRVTLGIGAVYAETLLDRSRLEKAVSSLNIPERAKAAFVDATFAAKARLDASVAAFDSRRRALYVDVPRKVFEERKLYRERHASAYRELDTLEARAASARSSKKAPDDLVRSLDALRADYLAHCGDATCRFDPLIVEVTRELVLLFIAADDSLRARAENALLRERSAGRHLLPVEVGEAVYRATEEERHAFTLREAAKASGMDATTLTARFGATPPIHIDAQPELLTSDSLSDLTVVLGDAATFATVSGIVKSVTDARKQNEKGEPLAQVSFRDVVTQSDVTECVHTGKVVGVTFDSRNHATLEFQRACTVVGTRTNVEKTAPVLVPASETRHVGPDEHLQALVAIDTRQGVVVRSLAKGVAQGPKPAITPVLQIRGDRVGVGKP